MHGVFTVCSKTQLDTQITHGLQLFVHRNTRGFYLINLQIAVTQRA